jgi:hypothetical protein
MLIPMVNTPTGLCERTFPTPFFPQPVENNTDGSLHYFDLLATKEKEGEEDTIQFLYVRIPHRVFEEKDCRTKGIIEWCSQGWIFIFLNGGVEKFLVGCNWHC